VIEVRDGGTSEWFAEPGDYGLATGSLADVAGGEPEDNAAIARSVLLGDDGTARDISLLNAGAAIYVGGGAPDLASGVEAARRAVDSGAAQAVLDRLATA
jgi:anthranilate phosphoribosyltransferase